MNQRFERQVMEREYEYKNGDYVYAIDLGLVGFDCDLGLVGGNLHVTVSDPKTNSLVDEFELKVNHTLGENVEYSYNNGVITLIDYAEVEVPEDFEPSEDVESKSGTKAETESESNDVIQDSENADASDNNEDVNEEEDSE